MIKDTRNDTEAQSVARSVIHAGGIAAKEGALTAVLSSYNRKRDAMRRAVISALIDADRQHSSHPGLDADYVERLADAALNTISNLLYKEEI